MAAPLFSAVIAAPLSDPKLIAETFTSDGGRNAFARPRAPPSTLAARQRHGRVGVDGLALGGRHGERAVLDDRVVVDPLEVVVGSETEVAIGRLRRRVDPAPLISAEGLLRVVVGDDVLAQFGADTFQKEAQVADDRIVAQDGVMPLQQVIACKPGQAGADGRGDGAQLHAGDEGRSAAAL